MPTAPTNADGAIAFAHFALISEETPAPHRAKFKRRKRQNRSCHYALTNMG